MPLVVSVSCLCICSRLETVLNFKGMLLLDVPSGHVELAKELQAKLTARRTTAGKAVGNVRLFATPDLNYSTSDLYCTFTTKNVAAFSCCSNIRPIVFFVISMREYEALSIVIY